MTLRTRASGFTFIEMMAVCTLLAVLAGAAIPAVNIAVKRDKEVELRRNLRTLREAIDAYKRLADEKRIEVEEDSEGYPPDLETLVKGVEVSEAPAGEAGAGAGAGDETIAADESGGLGQSAFGENPADRSGSAGDQKKTVKFLRRIPVDPFTNSTDWGLRSFQDDRDSETWGRENVYDVFTRSRGTALDGTKYKDW